MKAAQLIALASRILLMNQPPQKTPATSDFMKRSRWEDLERSHPFIELNILESSPRLNSNETTHHPERRRIQSRLKDAGLGGPERLGLGGRFPASTRDQSHPVVPAPIPHLQAPLLLVCGLSVAVPQQLGCSLRWWEAGVHDGGRQRNAAGEIGIGRIQSPTFK